MSRSFTGAPPLRERDGAGAPPPATVRSAARRIREGSSSPLELFELAAARIRAVDPVVRAFVAFDEESARADAEELSREAARGELRGPLHGVPIAVKDVIDVRGLPTRGGSLATDDTPAAADAPAVRRLREAGALLLGKTATHEFAHGVTTPPTRNPWDTDRIPGGSSGGSAAAVASGQCLAALGSDTGGSVRVPASLCGVSGLRPLPGDVSTDGILPFSPRLDTCGPLARDAADLAVLFEVLSGRRCRPDSSIDRLRVGTVPAEALGEVDDEVAAAVDAAVRLLTGAGATVSPVAVPPFGAWSAPRATYVLADFLDVHRQAGWYPDRRDRYGEEVAGYLAQAERITDEERAAAVRELEGLERGLRAGLAAADVVVLPTTAIPAPEVADCEVRPHVQGRAPVVGTLMRLCGPFSWCGLAAVSIPCGFTKTGLPIGLQVAGADAETVLAVAMAYQLRTDHHLRQAPPPAV